MSINVPSLSGAEATSTEWRMSFEPAWRRTTFGEGVWERM